MAIIGGASEQLSSLSDMLPASGEVKEAFDKLDEEQMGELENQAAQEKPPGMGIHYLALIDGILLFTIALIGISFVISQRLHARIQGIATLVFSIIIILLGLALIFLALASLMLMVVLLLAIPFGTLIYLVTYGFFDRGAAVTILSLIMTLKVGFVVSLVLSNQRYLQNKGLVLLIGTSFLATVIVGLLHSLVPRFLVSITDGISAIVVAVLAIVWVIVLLIGSIPSLARAIQLTRV